MLAHSPADLSEYLLTRRAAAPRQLCSLQVGWARFRRKRYNVCKNMNAPRLRPRSWVVLFGILLATGSAPRTLGATAAAAADPVEAAASAAGVSGEGIGPIRLSMAAAEVQKALPAKWRKGKVEENMADERFEQVWTDAGQGLTLRFVAAKKAGPFTLGVIRVSAPCAAKTRRGITIGSTVAELERAYGAFKNPGMSSADELRIGPGHYGMLFSLQAGKVSAIKMGEFGDGG